ncbi:unnamed protein product [Pedinophyceae sp. YPF-701]|nr:unnamed protein product [Pedinophyceae sp. YPF-701]
MGNGVSQEVVARYDPLLSKISGAQPIELRDQTWQDLLSIDTSLPAADPEALEASLAPYCLALEENNGVTWNYHKLLLQVVEHLRGAEGCTSVPQRAVNTVYLARAFTKHAIQTLSSEALIAFSKDPPGVVPDHPVPHLRRSTHSVVQTVLRAAAGFFVSEPINQHSYLLHHEVLTLLLVAFSTQLFTPLPCAPTGTHPYAEAFMALPELAPALLERLVSCVVDRAPLPRGVSIHTPRRPDKPGASGAGSATSVVSYLSSALTSTLMLPFTAAKYAVGSNSPGGSHHAARPTPSPSPLGDAATMTLLVIVHYAPPENAPPNAFRSALHALEDLDLEQGDAQAALAEDGHAGGNSPRVSCSAVLQALERDIATDPGPLLLYTFLHGSMQFRDFCLSRRADLSPLLLRVLEILHRPQDCASSRMYMLLITLLILSQDRDLAADIHTVTVPSVPWFKERRLTNVPLGSLTFATLLNTAQFNLVRLRDVYAHTNTLAALANLAPSATGLTSHAAQKLTFFVESLARRVARLEAAEAGGRNGAASDEVEPQAYSDFLRIVLEVISAILVHGIDANAELVYALLHRQRVFAALREAGRVPELLPNIETTIAFFQKHVDAELSGGAGGDGGTPPPQSAAEVRGIIERVLPSFPRDSLVPLPELRFTYEEEPRPEEFFVPCVWALVVSQSRHVPWDVGGVQIYAPEDSAHGNGGLGQDELMRSQSSVVASESGNV